MRQTLSHRYAFKTAVFRLHRPSSHKVAALRDAMFRSHRAYSKVLALLLPQVEHFASFRKGVARDGEIRKRAWPLLQPLPLANGAKAGVLADLAAQLSSYIELGRQPGVLAAVPTVAPLTVEEGSYAAALDNLAGSVNQVGEAAARDELQRQQLAGRLRPLNFTAYFWKAGFQLLRSADGRRLYAWLNLHPKDSRFARPVSVTELVDLRSGQPIAFTSKTGVLFPLAYGRDFQDEQFLRRGRPQSAKLVEREGAFELHVAFEFQAPKVEPRCWLGVDRGIYNLASLAVVDAGGGVLAEQNVDGRQLRHVQRQEERRQRTQQRRGKIYRRRARRHHAGEAVHVAANAIVATAAAHGAQVVLESLGPLASSARPRGRSNFNRLLGRAQYQKLAQVLSYKLAIAGLPPAKEVSAAYTSQTCPLCGHRAPENRPKLPAADGYRMARFDCRRCGHQADADLNAARVIALKRQWRESLPPAERALRMDELPAERRFDTFIRNRAAMRGEGPCGRKAGSSGGPGLGVAGEGRPSSERATARTARRQKGTAAKQPRPCSSSETPPASDQQALLPQVLASMSGRAADEAGADQRIDAILALLVAGREAGEVG